MDNKAFFETLPNNIKNLVNFYTWDIELKISDDKIINIMDNEFIDYIDAASIRGIKIINKLTINNCEIFKKYIKLEKIHGLPPLIKTTNLSYLLHYSKVVDGNLNDWDVSCVIDMNNMFLWSEYNQPLDKWDVSNVTNMSSMFKNSKYNYPLNKWDVSNVTDMSFMFYSSEFSHCLKDWNVSNVKNMFFMLVGSKYIYPLNSLDFFRPKNIYKTLLNCNYNYTFENWDIKYIDKNYIFYHCKYSNITGDIKFLIVLFMLFLFTSISIIS